ncbi:MAG: hypothetical protein KDG55_04240 [Rhodocyclaceae bacterium]|nr:hypothetical protein [Rhodocyclaceae bacterium]
MKRELPPARAVHLHRHAPAQPSFAGSLLSASAGQRLLLAAAGLVPLWLFVWWAMQ